MNTNQKSKPLPRDYEKATNLIKPSFKARRITVIEYPGRVVNIQKAINTLGGLNKISKELKDKNKEPDIKLNFRPENILSKQILSTVQSTRQIVLKIRTRDNSKVEKVELVGFIDKRIVFTGMADFHYFVNPDTLMHKLKKDIFDVNLPGISNFVKNIKPNLNPITDLEKLCPVYLSPRTSVFKYNYQQNTHLEPINHETPKGTRTKLVRIRAKKSVGISLVSFETDEADIPTTYDERFEKFRKEFTEGILQKTQKLFEERPIWTSTALKYELDDLPKETFRMLISLHAYVMCDGPWSGCFVRLGYNPKKDIEARFYQIIMIKKTKLHRLEHVKDLENKNELKDIEEIRAKCLKSTHHIVTEDFMSSLRTFQICDLRVKRLEKYINTRCLISNDTKCNKIFGYYHPFIIERIRQILQQVKLKLHHPNQMYNKHAISSFTVAYKPAFPRPMNKSIGDEYLSDTEDERLIEIYDKWRKDVETRAQKNIGKPKKKRQPNNSNFDELADTRQLKKETILDQFIESNEDEPDETKNLEKEYEMDHNDLRDNDEFMEFNSMLLG